MTQMMKRGRMDKRERKSRDEADGFCSEGKSKHKLGTLKFTQRDRVSGCKERGILKYREKGRGKE